MVFLTVDRKDDWKAGWLECGMVGLRVATTVAWMALPKASCLAASMDDLSADEMVAVLELRLVASTASMKVGSMVARSEPL